MTVTYDLDLNTAVLEKALTGPDGAVTEFLESYARQVVAAAVLKAPVKTGNLRRSIHSEKVEHEGPFRASISIVADAQYASFVHDGTRPHTIRPVNKKALRFKVGGKTVFAQFVNHPGTKARPFLKNAAEEVAARML